jgi:hypothetical protein
VGLEGGKSKKIKKISNCKNIEHTSKIKVSPSLLTVNTIDRFGTTEASVFHMTRFEAASMPEEGSSSKTTVGLPTLGLSHALFGGNTKSQFLLPSSAMARLSFLLLPPESFSAMRSEKLDKPTARSTSRTLCSTSATPLMRA